MYSHTGQYDHTLSKKQLYHVTHSLHPEDFTTNISLRLKFKNSDLYQYTRSRLITEVKHRRAWIVLGWGTAWEPPADSPSYPIHTCRLSADHPRIIRPPNNRQAQGHYVTDEQCIHTPANMIIHCLRNNYTMLPIHYTLKTLLRTFPCGWNLKIVIYINTPVLVWSRKLSIVGPGSYLDGGPPGNSRRIAPAILFTLAGCRRTTPV